jgi:hypothetical protein
MVSVDVVVLAEQREAWVGWKVPLPMVSSLLSKDLK